MRNAITAVTVSSALALASHAGASIVLVDFGPTATITSSPDTNGNTWNNYTQGAFLNLLATDGSGAGFNLGATTNNAAGANGGLTNPQASLLGDFAITSATTDYFFTTSTIGFELSALDPTKTYDLRLFGTRATDGTRITDYTATDANGTQSVQLQTSGAGIGADGIYNGNDDEIVSILGLTPTAGGEITLDVSVVSGGFAYLGALEIVEVPAPSTAVALLALAGVTRRRRH